MAKINIVGDGVTVELTKAVGYDNQIIPLNEITELEPYFGYSSWYVVITPDEGVEILDVESLPKSNYDPSQGGVVGFDFSERTDGSFRAAYGSPTSGVNTTFTVTVETIGGGGESLITPFNRLYLMDSDSLTSLGEIPIYYDAGGEPVDLSTYILKLVNIPFKLPSELFPNLVDVKLGSYDTGIQVPRLESDVLVFDFGEIIVTDNGDLLNSSFEYDLHFPYVSDVIRLEPSEVLGKVISSEISLDGYSGGYTISVFNGGEFPIRNIIGSLGIDVPIKLAREVFNSIGNMQGVYNNVTKAFIRITKPVLIESEYTNLITSSGSLVGLKGYVEILQSNFDFNGSLTDRSELLSILKQGVFINE